MKKSIRNRTDKNSGRRSGVRKPLLLMAVGLMLTCLSGCAKEKAHYTDVQRKAEKYFKEKYGEKASVVNSTVAGNYGLFGYLGVKDRAYEMSDGTMVYWNDEEQYFADNKQTEEITAALRSKVIEPALSAMDPGCRVNEYTFNRTRMDSFDETVFREYYDGNLEAFAEKEEIIFSDFEAMVHESAYRAGVEEFYNTVGKYLKGDFGRVVVLR